MIAFHGSPQLKQSVLDRILRDELADGVRQAPHPAERGWTTLCTIAGGVPHKYEQEFGLPQMLAILSDHLLDGLPQDQAATFPRRVVDAIPVGADVSAVPWRFLHEMVRGACERTGVDFPEKLQTVLTILVAGSPIPPQLVADARRAADDMLRSADRKSAKGTAALAVVAVATAVESRFEAGDRPETAPHSRWATFALSMAAESAALARPWSLCRVAIWLLKGPYEATFVAKTAEVQHQSELLIGMLEKASVPDQADWK